MLLDNGVGALPKVLEAYMGEAVLPTHPPAMKRHGLRGRWPMGAKLPSMLRVVIVLLRQRDVQLKIPHLTIGYLLRESPKYMCRRVGYQAMSLKVRNMGS